MVGFFFGCGIFVDGVVIDGFYFRNDVVVKECGAFCSGVGSGGGVLVFCV